MIEKEMLTTEEQELNTAWRRAGGAPPAVWTRVSASGPAAPSHGWTRWATGLLATTMGVAVISVGLAGRHSLSPQPHVAAPAATPVLAQTPPTAVSQFHGTPAPSIPQASAPSSPASKPASTPAAGRVQSTVAPPAAAAAWPNASNTGVPAGTPLTPYNGNLIITTQGAHYDSLDIHGCVSIRASDVQITRSRVTTQVACGGQWRVYITPGTTGTLLQDFELDGQDVTGEDGIGDGNVTCIRCNIHGVSHGMRLNHGGTVQDSYIHDVLGGSNGDIDSEGNGAALTVVRHNTLDDANQSNGCFMLSADTAAISNWTIDDNLLNGGGYTVYGGAGGAYPATNMTITNNHFRRSPTGGYFPNGGYWGPVAYWPSGPGNTWSGNVWDDNGSTVPS